MNGIIIYVTRFIFILSSSYYFYGVFRLYLAMKKEDEYGQGFFFNSLRLTQLMTHFFGFLVLAMMSENKAQIVILYGEQAAFFIVLWLIIGKAYKKSNLSLWAISLYLLQLSFVFLARLDFEVGERQFKLALLGAVVAVAIPILYKKMNFQSKLNILYAVASLGLLFAVNDTVNGAQNWLTIGTFTFQPSELVKFLYLLWIASFLRKGINFTKLILSAIFSAAVVLILVYQRDLGGALIFYIVYVTLVFIETANPLYFLGGLSFGGVAAYFSYHFFDHVKVRVVAWMNPWSYIEDQGYQIAQSLFAIGAGGFFGTGITKGLPKKIPVALTDFIFSGIYEEFGGIFCFFLIGILILFLFSAFYTALISKDHFNMILSAGIGTLITIQNFLIIGGVTKLVPSTGVTLPFVSYGGTSLISSFVLLGLLQGVYLKNKSLSSIGDHHEQGDNELRKE